MAWAERGNATNVVPTECNAAPTETSDPTATKVTPDPAPTCFHVADLDGGHGLCPNLANYGWCDCGPAGTYSTLKVENICGYGTLASSASILLSSTNCATSTTVPAVAMVPIEATSRAPPASMPASASPVTTNAAKRRQITRLRKRGGAVTFDASCDAAPPAGSSWGSSSGFSAVQAVLQAAYNDAAPPTGSLWGSYSGFSTMKDVLQAAYNDAVVLATASQDVAADNSGFAHYFGGELADEQLTHFQNMMKAVASSEANYAIRFECQDTGNDCTRNSIMVTDATPGSATDVKAITVCPLFWTHVSTGYLVYDSSKTSPSRPYRDNTASGWCGKRAQNGDINVSAQKHGFFATAGHSVLHELTHLDALANKAGLEADGDELDAHGTDDSQREPDMAGARAFLQSYILDDTDGASPDYNAESYAAAATEIYFMDLCGFSQIRPVTP